MSLPGEIVPEGLLYADIPKVVVDDLYGLPERDDHVGGISRPLGGIDVAADPSSHEERFLSEVVFRLCLDAVLHDMGAYGPYGIEGYVNGRVKAVCDPVTGLKRVIVNCLPLRCKSFRLLTAGEADDGQQHAYGAFGCV
jgi:hypothetical protein